MIEFSLQRGSIYATGPSVERCARDLPEGVRIPVTYTQQREKRDGHEHHVTIAHKTLFTGLAINAEVLLSDLRSALTKSERKNTGEMENYDPSWVCLGLCNVQRIYFKILCWPVVNAVLLRHGLKASLFHITIGFETEDNHRISRTSEHLIPQKSLSSTLHSALARTDDAEARLYICQACLKHNPVDARALVKRAVTHAKMKNLQACIRDAKAALDLDPQLPKAWLTLARAQLTCGQREEAFLTCRTAIATLRKKSSEGRLEASKLISRIVETQALCSISLCSLIKFPPTKHLFDAGAATRNDLVLTEGSREYQMLMQISTKCDLVFTVEEKLDGANLGLWADATGKIHGKNRGHGVCAALGGQWRALDSWIAENSCTLLEILVPDRLILYGEWLYATHSIEYTELSSYFVAFDIYDAELEQFMSVEQRDRILHGTGIPTAPKLNLSRLSTPYTAHSLLDFIDHVPSAFSPSCKVEGIVLRADTSTGEHVCRAKVVRGEFRNQIGSHWSQGPLLRNKIVVKPTEKYPKTPHLPCSPGQNEDDIQLTPAESDQLSTERIVITEKLDGGNCLLFQGQVFARTHKRPAEHWSFGRTREVYRGICVSFPDIARRYELYGENMGAVHRIVYNALAHSFYLFAVRDHLSGKWLSFEETESIALHLGVPVAPKVFEGTLSARSLQQLLEDEAGQRSRASTDHEVRPEGFVVRYAGSFFDSEFSRSVAKYVRPSFRGVLDSATWSRTAAPATLNPENAKEAFRPPLSSQFRLFVDLDGVLADFDLGVKEITGKLPSEMGATAMWRAIDGAAKPFFQNLHWMPNARDLWLALAPHQPCILSGIPMESGSKFAKQKRSWCAKHLGHAVTVHLCASRNKHEYCQSKRDILIDDRSSNGKQWETKGGTFVHHTSVRATLEALGKLGVLKHETTKSGLQQKHKKAAKATKRKYRFLILVGLPGSGKSTFSKMLDANRWRVVSQDEVGSKRACENMIGQLSKRHCVVLDRCNPTAKERRFWRSLSFCTDAQVAIVYFAADVKTCIERVKSRKNHPTLQPQSAELVVKSFAKSLDIPTMSEGFSKIFTVHTREEVERLAKSM